MMPPLRLILNYFQEFNTSRTKAHITTTTTTIIIIIIIIRLQTKQVEIEAIIQRIQLLLTTTTIILHYPQLLNILNYMMKKGNPCWKMKYITYIDFNIIE